MPSAGGVGGVTEKPEPLKIPGKTAICSAIKLRKVQHQKEPEFSCMIARAALYPAGDFAYSIVSFDEQTRGTHAFIKAARRPAEVVERYRLLEVLLGDYAAMTVLPFDDGAAAEFSKLTAVRARVATTDLRIASIALSRGLIVLTRNTRDFGKVPGLVTEDWTA
jgi:tRNA(fMet)-specific endonuclease VapC